MKKKILIPYASYGNGHKAIAEYIKTYFELQSSEYEIMTLDLLIYSLPIIGKVSKKLSTNLMVNHPFLWNIIYSVFDNKVTGILSNTLILKMFKNKSLENEIRNFNPDLTISTHFFGSSLIANYNKKKYVNSNLITVITDYSAHEFWLKNIKAEDAIVVGNKEEANLLAKKGIDRKKIKPFGIPVAPIIDSNFNRDEAILKYGFSGKAPICLFFGGGSDGNMASLPYIKEIMKKRLDIDFIYVAGKNKKAKQKVEHMVNKYNATNFKVLGFVNNVPELFQICDFVITKPGGAQTTECLYFKKPTIFINCSGGQEKANYRYFEKNGYGIKFSYPFTFMWLLKKINSNPKTLDNMKKKINQNKNNHAMNKLYKLAFEILRNKDRL